MRSEIQSFAIITVFILLFMSFEENRACRLLNGEFEKTQMKNANILLSSLQRGPVRPPGNGCGNTGNGGNPCVGSKKVASRHTHGIGASPPPPPVTATPASTDH
ncbi:hypothetical protein L1887_05900 [Cichorium endivia]|nr:hypothetical protein L1887_05900 [Cichorium endivia]